MGFFFNRHKQDIPRNATFRITESGREKLSDFTGDPMSQVLVALETRGTLNMEEISNACQLSRGQIDRLLPGCLKAGYVSLSSATDILD